MACAAAAGAGVVGGGAMCCCGSALAICPWSRAKYRSACLMLNRCHLQLSASVLRPAAGVVVLGTKTADLLALVGLQWPC
jgi:hypothetical protein